jgi:hypothetical protein
MVATWNRDDLKAVVRELMQEILWEMEQQLPDPDIDLEFRPEIAEYLLKPLEDKGPLWSLDDIKRELGFDE